MIDYNRKCLVNKYHVIEVLDCSIDIILFAAELSSQNVTVENIKSYQQLDLVDLTLQLDGLKISPTVLKYEFDLKILKQEFLSLGKIWDKQGCYAVFHDKDFLKFKATDLDNLARYKALDNFNWTLEIAIPGPASSGWGHIASPSSTLIDKVEREIKNKY